MEDNADAPGHLDPLTHVARPDHPDAVAQARTEAGRAIRDIGHSVVGHAAPLELIERVTRQLDELVTELDRHPGRKRSDERPEGDWDPPPADGEPMISYDERPISGRSSPWGLDLDVRREGDEVVGRVTLRPAHEGAPGRSHGGIVAALFDDVFGFVLNLRSQPAFTGEISVRYEAGTPVGTPLECRVRATGQERRKLYMTGELTDARDGSVVATSTATFITIDPSSYASAAG
ncbi:MAG: PaaI family thioesterase [Ilumatobacteraceae bacterium]